MAKYVCKVCGYVYEGESAPEKCPICGVDSSKFEKQEEGKMSWACFAVGSPSIIWDFLRRISHEDDPTRILYIPGNVTQAPSSTL